MNNASASIFSLLMGTIARKKMEFNKNLSNRTFFKNLEKNKFIIQNQLLHFSIRHFWWLCFLSLSGQRILISYL